MDSKEVGILGEEVACNFLRKKGYRILDRNYLKELSALQKGEIDIIAEKGGVISFVEVKTSESPARTGGAFLPEDRVDFRKRKQLIKFAQMWLGQNRISIESPWQVDVISVRIDANSKKAKIRHFKNAIC